MCCLQVLARVGVAYAEVVQEPQLLLKSQEMEVDAKWGHRLAKYKVRLLTLKLLVANLDDTK